MSHTQEATRSVLDASRASVSPLSLIPVGENAHTRTYERPDPSGLQ